MRQSLWYCRWFVWNFRCFVWIVRDEIVFLAFVVLLKSKMCSLWNFCSSNSSLALWTNSWIAISWSHYLTKKRKKNHHKKHHFMENEAFVELLFWSVYLSPGAYHKIKYKRGRSCMERNYENRHRIKCLNSKVQK